MMRISTTLALVVGLFSACGANTSASKLTESLSASKNARFSESEIRSVTSGTLMIKRYGNGGDLPVTALTVTDHTGSVFGNNYDVAVELKGFFPVANGLKKEACVARMTRLIRDVDTWKSVKQNGNGEPLYTVSKRIDAQGNDLSSYQISNDPLTETPEHHYLRLEAKQSFGNTKFKMHTIASATNDGLIRASVFNFTQVTGTFLFGISIPLMNEGDLRNYSEMIPHENGFLFYTVGKIKVAYDVIRSSIGPTTLEPGSIGTFMRYKEACAKP